MRHTVLILAGGVGSRVGANIPKQYVEVGGKAVPFVTVDSATGDYHA